MNFDHVPKLTLVLLAAILLASAAFESRAADLQAKTIDGQVIQGEYLGTENNIVRIKTSYGIVSIPSKNIVTLLAVNIPDKPAGPPAVREEDVNLDAMVFKPPQNVNITSLLAARMPRIPEADVRSRLELFRCIRNFGDSSDTSRQHIVRTMANYGLMAYPYIDGAYIGTNELDDKVELVQAVVGPKKPYCTQILMSVHSSLLGEISRTATLPPELPSEIIVKRAPIASREQRMRVLAHDCRQVEGYASASGGPFNALFLLNVYRIRYSGEADALLKNLSADRARLSAVAVDCKNVANGWTPPDRVLLIEMVFPWLYQDNDDLVILGQEILKKLLPDRHPKWEAPQAEWFQWWMKHRREILNSK